MADSAVFFLRPPVFFFCLTALFAVSLALTLRSIKSRDAEIARMGALEEDNARLKKELELLGQMHEGLKGQYDELEAHCAQRFEQSPEEPKKLS